MKSLILKVCRLYNVFGSGASHGIYAQFIQQSGVHNNGQRIGLLRGAGTRFATYFYAMMRLLRLQAPLLATIHQAIFSDLNLNDRVRSAVMDIEDKAFWKALYTLVRAVFPAIRALRYCDSNTPAMDKIFHLSYRTTCAIEHSCEKLNDADLFGPIHGDIDLEREQIEVFGHEVIPPAQNTTVASDDDDTVNDPVTFSLGNRILFEWEKRRNKLEHDYSIAGWALSVMPAVRADVVERLLGIHRDAIERVIVKLHEPPCPNRSNEIKDKTIGDIKHMFWLEFKDFQQKTGPFGKEDRWLTSTALRGSSHIWHELYSLPYTGVLGFVACRVCLKSLGIGPCERSWGDVKSIKSGKRSHLGGDSIKKRAVLYTTAKIHASRIKRNIMECIDAEGPNAMFGDDDMKYVDIFLCYLSYYKSLTQQILFFLSFDHQLENFGVEISDLKQPVTHRIFRAWVEDWEKDAIHKDCCVSEARVLTKYRDLAFFDPDDNVTRTIYPKNLEWVKKTRGMAGSRSRWAILGTHPDNDDDDDKIEPFEISDLVIDLIVKTPQAAGVKILQQELIVEEVEGNGEDTMSAAVGGDQEELV